MNEFELLLPDGTGAGIWMCDVCRRCYDHPDSAARCGLCFVCGQPVDGGGHKGSVHSKCIIEAQRQQRQAQVEQAIKLDAWDGFVFWDEPGLADIHIYQPSVEALAEVAWDQGLPHPEWAFVCEPRRHQVEADAIIDDLLDDTLFETDDVHGMDELDAALNAFNAANTHLVDYYPDFTRVVRVPEHRPSGKE